MKLSKSIALAGSWAILLGTNALAQEVLETGSRKPMPAVWIDKDTGHKVMRFNGATGNAINNWYFHNNPFFKQKRSEGDKMVFSDTDGKNRQVFLVNLKTMAVEQVTKGATDKRLLAMSAPATREFIYQVNDSVFAGSIDTKKTRFMCVLPTGKGSISTVNADATMFAGKLNNPAERAILQQYPEKSQYFNRIYDAHLTNTIFTIDVKTGALKNIHEENNWMGHIQFSPTDPNILMFCHEGPWEKVDRVWRYNIKTEGLTLMHERTMPMEIAGHEFFQPDGKVIWFDLQKPKGKTFFLSGTNVSTGKEVATYEMNANEWSIHFAIYPEKKLFAGDGGDPSQVAKAPDGMWIQVFRPEGNRFKPERLVNMKAHGYRALEPNVHFTPDGNWIIFGGNFEGANNTYAVEIAKHQN